MESDSRKARAMEAEKGRSKLGRNHCFRTPAEVFGGVTDDLTSSAGKFSVEEAAVKVSAARQSQHPNDQVMGEGYSEFSWSNSPPGKSSQDLPRKVYSELLSGPLFCPGE